MTSAALLGHYAFTDGIRRPVYAGPKGDSTSWAATASRFAAMTAAGGPAGDRGGHALGAAIAGVARLRAGAKLENNMRTDPLNPARNAIPPGIKESALLHSIETSGYPLQGVAASKLIQQGFKVVEEWGYIDRDTKEHRSLDVFGTKELGGNTDPVRPGMALLAECKRSPHPHVFFQSVANRPVPSFPAVRGLLLGHVPIEEQGGKRTAEAQPAAVLGLSGHVFCEPGPPKCASFSRATPKGNSVTLSGEEIFSGLVLPLVKAFDHTTDLYKPVGASDIIFPTLLINVGVLDSPMILVESPDRASDPVLTPWVRVVRQESHPHPHRRIQYRWYAIDVVHIDFFEAYLTDHILPLADEFAKRVMQQESILRYGGVVANLDKWQWDEITLRADQRR